jgi:hypothetical protein
MTNMATSAARPIQRVSSCGVITPLLLGGQSVLVVGLPLCRVVGTNCKSQFGNYLLHEQGLRTTPRCCPRASPGPDLRPRSHPSGEDPAI